MVKKLIVNADDFGLTEGVVRGIIRTHQDGILTSTTAMVNMPYIELAAEMAKENPKLGVGIHFVLTMGAPLTDGKSFTSENGNFKRPSEYGGNPPIADQDELYVEWKTQMEKFIKVFGKKPTHIDSHHHTHMNGTNFDVAIRLAKEYNLPIRIAYRDVPADEMEKYNSLGYEYVPCVMNFYAEDATIDFLLNDKGNIKDLEIAEIMCHPAFVDKRMLDISSYAIPRTQEMAVLRDQKVKDWVKDNNIELISFADIKKK